jgi:NTE family protein
MNLRAGPVRSARTAPARLRGALLAALVAAAATLAGCASPPRSAQPLDAIDPAAGYRFVTTPAGDNSNSLMVVAAFSGGGMRAAALSYAVLEELARTEITWEGQRKRLLDELDAVSAVSGGSATAAYYALRGERMFDDFESRFLARDLQGEIIGRALNPFNWGRLAASNFGRSDLVAELLDEALFDGATFGDLARRARRPFVTINATDMATGHRFEFIQEQFDLMCADLSTLPLARAVAASAAVPLVLSPITLRNHAERCVMPEPLWVSYALRERRLSSRLFYNASKLRAYRDAAAHPYVHLLDGGLSDNLGLRSTLDSVLMMDGAWNFSRSVGIAEIRAVVFIVVNASNETDRSYAREGGIPGLLTVLNVTKDIPLDRYSFETKELLRANFAQWAADVKRNRDDGEGVEFFFVDVDFEALPDKAERDYLRGIPTRWSLPDGALPRIRAAARALLEESDEFQRLLRKLRD